MSVFRGTVHEPTTSVATDEDRELRFADPTYEVVTDGSPEAERDVYLDRVRAAACAAKLADEGWLKLKRALYLYERSGHTSGLAVGPDAPGACENLKESNHGV